MQQRLQGFFKSQEGQNCAVATTLGREALVGRHFAATYEGSYKNVWHRVLGRPTLNAAVIMTNLYLDGQKSLH